YEGLKEEVKDELSRQDRPEEFLKYVELAIKLDNRLYERRKERRQTPQANTGKRYQPRFQGQNRPRNHQWQPRQPTS
ncbi:hypothetical protein, partial [Salmonella enterica]|uniref:hypothetical protein n=1 Tax=Salmonella enterica TaxID=28901 RepID=UPI0020C420EE